MLITCPDCKKQMSDTAENCPHCGRPLDETEIATLRVEEKKNRTASYIMLGIFLLIVFLLVRSCVSPLVDHEPVSQAEQQAQKVKERKAFILIRTQRAVRNSLKAPSTASFGGMLDENNDAQTHVLPDAKEANLYLVHGWVDAQNSFGAHIRNTFAARVRWDDATQDIKVEKIIFEK